jgi:trehalose 6-phosphate synthase
VPDAAVTEEGTRRLLVASNRGPLTYRRGPDGSLQASRGAGGLVTALGGLAASHEVTWVASALGEEDREVAARGSFAELDAAGNAFRLRLIAHAPEDYDRFYNTFANPLLWFLQHELWPLAERPSIDRSTYRAWDSYQTVNRAFAEALAEEHTALGGPPVMLHDYQLYTAPAELRRRLPDAVITHFVHVPWPGLSGWRVLPRPMLEGIAGGLLSCDLVGFHTERWARSFLRFCADLGYGVDEEARVVHAGREVRVRVYPISVDVADFEEVARSPEVQTEERRLFAARPERVILRVDRTDPSKNIVRGFQAFGLFLEQHPEWRGRVRLVALLDPSRLDIPEYVEYLARIERAAADVGERFRDADGVSAVDLRIHDNFSEVVAGYRQYDVLLVNALLDGMNLIAKEAPLVNDRDGVVILSENAGAYAELGELALGINPFDVQATADAIAAALEMPPAERAERARGIREQVTRNDVQVWIDRQLADLEAVTAR